MPLEKDKPVAEMVVVGGEWEKELVVVCNGVVLGVDSMERELDRWKWEGGSDSNYTVRDAYFLLIEH